VVCNDWLTGWFFRLLRVGVETDAFVFKQLVENNAGLLFELLRHQSLKRLSWDALFLIFVLFQKTIFSFFVDRRRCHFFLFLDQGLSEGSEGKGVSVGFNLYLFDDRLDNRLSNNDWLVNDHWLGNDNWIL